MIFILISPQPRLITLVEGSSHAGANPASSIMCEQLDGSVQKPHHVEPAAGNVASVE